jgi:hypothetical protein
MLGLSIWVMDGLNQHSALEKSLLKDQDGQGGWSLMTRRGNEMEQIGKGSFHARSCTLWWGLVILFSVEKRH